MYFLGIDGGGTKTDFLLTDGEGKRIREKRTGTVSWRLVGVEQCIARLKHTVSEISAGLEGPAFLCMGYPNWGEYEAGDEAVRRRLGEISGSPVRVVNDCVVGWAGSLAMEPGINLVSGTGSIAYGRNEAGEEARAGGWSEHFSDEGSCYWLGMKALELFAKESDGRAEPGALLDIFRAHFNLKEDFGLIGLYDREYLNDRTKTAGLQKLLAQAAARGDREAEKLYGEAAGELALIVGAVYRKLGFQPGTAVSCSGGLFRNGNRILDPLGGRLRESGILLQAPRFTPVQGAVLLAADAAGGKACRERVIRGFERRTS